MRQCAIICNYHQTRRIAIQSACRKKIPPAVFLRHQLQNDWMVSVLSRRYIALWFIQYQIQIPFKFQRFSVDRKQHGHRIGFFRRGRYNPAVHSDSPFCNQCFDFFSRILPLRGNNFINSFQKFFSCFISSASCKICRLSALFLLRL